MKLLILSRYDRQGASSRLRTMQYVPYLESVGLHVQIASLFDAAYLEAMYSGRRSALMIWKYLSARLRQMRLSCDVIWLEKEALPWVPWFIEHLTWPRNTPLVVDYDDAVFHRYDTNRHAIVRALLGRKIDHVMQHATHVIAGNDYIARRAAEAGAKNVDIVPTVVDLTAYDPRKSVASTDKPVIGWIGTPQTWSSLASAYAPIVRDVSNENGASVRLIGALQEPASENGIEFLPWSEKAEAALLQGIDIGVMPLPDTPWTRGKCGYKLIQYMACGLPVVASPVGVNRDIVEHGVNGFLADSADEWRAALKTLIGDGDLRRRMGSAGRKKIEREFSLAGQAPRIEGILKNAVKAGSPAARHKNFTRT